MAKTTINCLKCGSKNIYRTKRRELPLGELFGIIDNQCNACGHYWTEEENMDNWKHRSDEMKCKTCMWFAEKVPSTPAGEEIPDKGIGRCRKHAPTMNGYPAVFPSDWCGDHKLDENKI